VYVVINEFVLLIFRMSLNEGYHNKIEPGAGSAGDDQASGSGSVRNSAAGDGPTTSKELHQQILNETTYLKPSKQAYFSDEKVLIPDDERTNVSLIKKFY